MASVAELAKGLNRSGLYLSGLHARFELPRAHTIANANALLEFFRVIIALRSLNVPEETLRELWFLEKKLLLLVHADGAGSPTWFLDACGHGVDRHRRLLLTNYDVGVDLTAGGLQLGLDFAGRPAELFAGNEMGEDALRVLGQCLNVNQTIFRQIRTEIPHLRAAINWAAPLAKQATG